MLRSTLKAVFGSRPVSIVVTTFAFYGVYLLHTQVVSPWLNREPVLPPTVRIENAKFYCASLGGFDDGASDEERLAMAVAHVNLAAQTGATPCDVFEHFGTLMVPGTSTKWFREQGVVHLNATRSEANRAKYEQVKKDLRAYLDDPLGSLKLYPWLACKPTTYIRTTWPLATPWQEKKAIRASENLTLAHTFPSGAQLFCPK